jgi:Domain of unknown function (DUF4105)
MKNLNLQFRKIEIVIICLLFFTHIKLNGQTKNVNPIQLSSQAEFSILTVDRADEELFQAFGHICIYLYDPVNQLDRVYSYGSFDFDTDNFYWKFITGQLPYQISVSNLQYTLLGYSAQYENRSVIQQNLELSLAQKQRVFNILEENLLPENKTYQYKFFQDNCSTRIRDVFKKSLSDSLKFNTKGIEQGKNFRFWMNKNLLNTPWARFGMNLAIGNPSDVTNTNEETFYLPNNMRIAFDNATNGGRPIVKNSMPLFTAVKPLIEKGFEFTPMVCFMVILIFGLGLSFYQFKNNIISTWFDKLLFISTGLLGILIIFLWFFTAHGVTMYNWNILWAWPTNLLIVFILNSKNRKTLTYFTVYQIAILIAIGLGIGFEFFKNEIYPLAILPILILLLARLSLLKVNLKAKYLNQNTYK